MKKFSSVFSCFHTDIMNKYIFPVPQKISGNFLENFLEIFRNIFFRKSYITNVRPMGHIRLATSRHVARDAQQESDYFRYIADIKSAVVHTSNFTTSHE